MREITDHIVNPANDKLRITVEDEPGVGGASHRYGIAGFNTATNASEAEGEPWPETGLLILFQNGPIAEHGVNGVTQEALLAIVADRLRSLQAGPLATVENGKARAHVEAALEWLHARTRSRMERGVEGTHQA